MFGHRINNSGFAGGMYWFYVLPLGFLLTMYTITGYDATAHLSEETRGAAKSAAKGVWRSVFYSACRLDRVLLAITFAAIHPSGDRPDDGDPDHHERADTAAAKAVLVISTVGQLFCGIACSTSASRMTFAFSRDGAVPGHNLWRRLGTNRTPTWSVLFVVVFAGHDHDPGVLPEPTRRAGGVPGRHIDLGHRPLHRVRDPRFPALADGRQVPGRAVDAGRKYKWINPIAIVWVAINVIIFWLPFSPAGVFFKHGFNWT